MRLNRAVAVVVTLFLLHAPATFLDAASQRTNEGPPGRFEAAFSDKTNRLFVAGGTAGTYVLNIKEGKLSLAGTWSDGGDHRSVALLGNRLYVADAARGLVVFDVEKGTPTYTSPQKDITGMVIRVYDHHAYLAAGVQGLLVYDISRPDMPELVGRFNADAPIYDLWVSGAYACVSNGRGELGVIDISTPSQPKSISAITWNTESTPTSTIQGENRVAHIAAHKQGLVIVDVARPQDPQVSARYELPNGGSVASLCVKDKLVYLVSSSEDHAEANGLIVLDAQDPRSPKFKGRCAVPGRFEAVCLGGDYVFLMGQSAGIKSIDIRDPMHPLPVDSITLSTGVAGSKNFLDTEMSERERETIAYFEKMRAEILNGRKFNDLSTPVNTLLTFLSALCHNDQDALERACPIARQLKEAFSPEGRSQIVDGLKTVIVHRIADKGGLAKESDFAGIYISHSPSPSPQEVLTFAYVEGAWRSLGSGGTADWLDSAKNAEAATRGILKEMAQENR